MDSLQLDIARLLVEKAKKRRRTTYQEVGEAIGWPHPTGRGLGRNLDVIVRYMLDNGLPPLTAILVERGEKHPPPNVIEQVAKDYAYRNIDEAQEGVFAFDWSSVPELSAVVEQVPIGREVWLTSFWGFDPDDWGCIGFADEPRRSRYLRLSRPGALDLGLVTNFDFNPLLAGQSFWVRSTGSMVLRGSTTGFSLSGIAGTNVGLAIDFVNLKLWARKNGGPWDAHGGDNPATNTGGVDISAFAGQDMFPFFATENATIAEVTANFGASAFAYTPPFGFVAWDVVE